MLPQRPHISKWWGRLWGWIHYGSLIGIHLSCSCREEPKKVENKENADMKYAVFTNTMIFGYLELSWESADRQKKKSQTCHWDWMSDCGQQHQENAEHFKVRQGYRLCCGIGFIAFRLALSSPPGTLGLQINLTHTHQTLHCLHWSGG